MFTIFIIGILASGDFCSIVVIYNKVEKLRW